jgi:hypothetical protein
MYARDLYRKLPSSSTGSSHTRFVERPHRPSIFVPPQRSAEPAFHGGAGHVSPAPSGHAAHHFDQIPIFSSAQTRALRFDCSSYLS